MKSGRWRTTTRSTSLRSEREKRSTIGLNWNDGAWHTFKIRWMPRETLWIIDDRIVLRRETTILPGTPMAVRFNSWTPRPDWKEAYNAAVNPAATAAETAVKAQDWNAARTALTAASGIAKTDDERYFVAALGVPVAANLKDNKTLATYLDALIASPRTPAADLPRYTFLRGNIEFEAKNYAAALPLLQKAQQAGFQNENLPVMIASSNLQTNNLPAGLAALDQAIKERESAGQKAPESWYNLAVSRLYAAKDQAGTA